MNKNTNVNEVLSFWFEETDDKKKFTKSSSFDALIKDRFESLYWDIVNGKTTHWRETAEGRLAEIIVLDQFARNMFRNDAQSFVADELALKLATEGIERGHDRELPPRKRLFMYMPFMHSESKQVHERALKLFTELGLEENLKYEKMHKEIIDRFERYPHRNEILNRESTPEEREFLKDNPGF